MQKKRKNIFWYFLAPVVLEWVISFVVQSVIELVYMVQNLVQVEKALENETVLIEFMNEMVVFLNQYATEITTLIAVCALPFLIRMYKKDKYEVSEWWEKKKEPNAKEIAMIVVLAACVCIAANNFILLSGITVQSETYLETAQLIYESPIIVQMIGLGILVPAMEEMVYRGLLYRRMREYLPTIVSVIGTAILFGIYHGNFVQLIYASIIGVFLAYLFEIFRSVKTAILFHAAANITSMVCTWIGAFDWIFSSIIHVAGVTVITCVLATAMFMMIQQNVTSTEKL